MIYNSHNPLDKNTTINHIRYFSTYLAYAIFKVPIAIHIFFRSLIINATFNDIRYFSKLCAQNNI